jgi:TetR/AcrR family transcriptional regulator, transcriptional repressor for nem operon
MADSRERLFAATMSSVAEKGYAATTVDEICAKAGVTKGAFFHHFPSKQSLTVAAVNNWSQKCNALYASAPYHVLKDPLERFLGYLNFRKNMLHVPMALTSSVVSMMIREISESHPDIRQACEQCISGQFARVESDIAEAIKLYGVDPRWSPESLAMHTHAVLQGLYVLVKSKDDIDIAEVSIDHLHHYVELLFQTPRNRQVQEN